MGKTTTTANLGAALAEAGRRVLVIDLDPQANLSMHLGVEIEPDEPSTYGVLVGEHDLAAGVRTISENLSLLPSLLDLSGAEMEIAGRIGRETLLRDALDAWAKSPASDDYDYVLIDCPPSLGLLSVNGLTASDEAFITLQTEFFALQGMSKLVEIVQLLRRRLHPDLQITGILPCLYDPRLRLAREVLAEIRRYFPGQVFKTTIRTNVKLAEAPSYGQTILQYAPDSNGAADYRSVAAEVLAQEDAARHGEQPATPPEPAREVAPEPVAQPAAQAAPEPDQPAGEEPGRAAARPSTVEENNAARMEYVLVPGQGLRPARPEPTAPPPRRAAPSADDLPPLPEEAFGTPRDS